MTNEVLGSQGDTRIRELPIELYDDNRHLHAFRRALASLPRRGVREAGHVMWLREQAFGQGAVVIHEGSHFPGAIPRGLRAVLGRLDAAGLPRPPVFVVAPGFRRGYGPKVAAIFARQMERDLAAAGVTGVRVVQEADAIAEVLGLDPAPFVEAEQVRYDESAARALQRRRVRENAAIEALVGGGWSQQVRRILVVDDQELNRRVLGAILLKTGGVAPEAIDSSDGTDVLERRFADPPPDLLILDSGLPGQDAATLVRAIRARETEAGLPRVPIASFTADVTDTFRRQLIDAGIDLFLPKPISIIDLLAAARTLLTRTPRPLRRILVVDDQELNARVARQLIDRILPGLEVETLNDPRAGLARCFADPRPDLLIVNGAMPHLSGPDLIRELRAAESRDALAPMPVIIASAGWDLLEAGLGAGADLAVSLPWDTLELVLSVRALFPAVPVALPGPRA